MITETMTPQETLDEMIRDRVELMQLVRQYFLRGGCKHLRTSKIFPCQVACMLKTKTANNYITIMAFNSKRDVFNFNPILSFGAVVETEKGKMLLCANLNMDARAVKPFYFLPHLFQRFKERMGYKQEGIELVRAFYKRNSDLVMHTDYRRNGKDGDKYVMLTCHDGAVFGYRHPDDRDTLVLCTFVANDTMQDGYKARFNWRFNDAIKDGEKEVAMLMPTYAANPTKLRKQ